MASSRNSTSRSKSPAWEGIVERALKDCLARVSFSSHPPIFAVAYSGGLDSSMLLHAAHHFAARHAVRIFAFHIHHGLNPRADDWLAHCERVAQCYGISFAARKVKVDKRSGLGVEEAARQARYAALGELCRMHGIPLLVTAHHLDDQAETVLLQLMRGAGLRGLSGMPSFTERHELLGNGVALARPLLTVARTILSSEARRLGVLHIEDDSNTDVHYRRNALRHQVVPVLREIFPSFESCISRSSIHLQHAQCLLDDLGEMDFQRCCANEGSGLNLSAMKGLSADRIDNLLRYWLAQQKVVLPSHAQLQQIREQMLNASPDREPRYDCGALHLRRLGNHLVREEENSAVPPAVSRILIWHGEDFIDVPEWRGRLIFQKSEEGGINPQRLLQTQLVLHPRSGQERLKLAPNRPSKMLKNLYQETGLLPSERRWLPLISLQDQLLFAAGLGMDVRRLDTDFGIRFHWEKL